MKFFSIKPLALISLFLVSTSFICYYQIKFSEDGPKALSPQESLKAFQISDEFKIELVASEPLIAEPSAVCWDQHGQMYVSELHGYNLEGQLEIEDLNKTGKIDTIVRRIEADHKYKKAAEAGIYGTVKKLVDTNKDGQMDKAIMFADRLPPVYGLCAANDGIIVAGQSNIVYLADKNNDGKAEVVDTLFSGFQGGLLERGINAPQWGPDGWIYFGRGWNGGKITGKYLKEAVDLPGTNFRIKSNGAAIEPITGGTHTIGHAFTADGESFFCNTWKHALYAAPIPWKYLSRNPNASISSVEADASDYSAVYPTAEVHPWKLARSNQKEWNGLYAKYGLAESAAGGYFTSSCSPMIYQDNLFPAEYNGNYLICEPAQCMIHRCIIEKKGIEFRVKRAKNEQKKEFLTSNDSWFRPVSITTGPEGSMYVTDMYREIIEDYSAVPRFMQQKYGLKNGMEHGRIWRISPKKTPKLANIAPVLFTKDNIASYLDSPHYWYRQTADRLIREMKGDNADLLKKREFKITNVTEHTPSNIFIKTLRQQDAAVIENVDLVKRLAPLSKKITNERSLLQLALSLGYSKEKLAFESLVDLARNHAKIRWMPDAIMTGMNDRSATMIASLLKNSGKHGHLMFEPLGESIVASKNRQELNGMFEALSQTNNASYQAAILRGVNKNIDELELTDQLKKTVLKLTQSNNMAVKGIAISMANKLKIGDEKQLETLYTNAIKDLSNTNLTSQRQLEAVSLLADAPDQLAGIALVNAYQTALFPVKSAIIDALIYRGNRTRYLINAFGENKISASVLLPSQRSFLLEQADGVMRPKLDAELAKTANPDKESMFNKYAPALLSANDTKHGREIFEQMCSICHKVGNIGTAVGPDLKNSYSNSNQTILRNILFPSEKIASSYETYTVQTKDNKSFSGIMVSETSTNVVLRYAGGAEQTFLRRNIAKMGSSATSLMPEYGQALSSKECADLIFWLKETLAQK